MASGLGSADLFRMLGSFALVLALMAALLWALRKLQTRMSAQGTGRRMQIIRILERGSCARKFALVAGWRTPKCWWASPPAQMTSLAQWPADPWALHFKRKPIRHRRNACCVNC
jgi:hypothetical protein